MKQKPICLPKMVLIQNKIIEGRTQNRQLPYLHKLLLSSLMHQRIHTLLPKHVSIVKIELEILTNYRRI
jgi:hypothetical protein